MALKAHAGGLAELTLVVDANKAKIADLVKHFNDGGAEWEMDLKPVSHKRSLDANSLYWVLINKMAKVLGVGNEEMHENQLRKYSVLVTDANNRILAFKLKEGINPHYITKYVIETGESYESGQKFIHYAILKGSHEMTTREFAHLLEMTALDAKELGIDDD